MLNKTTKRIIAIVTAEIAKGAKTSGRLLVADVNISTVAGISLSRSNKPVTILTANSIIEPKNSIILFNASPISTFNHLPYDQ